MEKENENTHTKSKSEELPENSNSKKPAELPYKLEFRDVVINGEKQRVLVKVYPSQLAKSDQLTTPMTFIDGKVGDNLNLYYQPTTQLNDILCAPFMGGILIHKG